MTGARRWTLPVPFRAARRGAAALLSAAALVAVPALPASAGFGTEPGTTPPPASGGPQSTTVRSCRLYAQPDSFGMTCGRGDGSAESIRQILGSDPLPGCWDDPLPADLRALYQADIDRRRALGEQGDYYLTICLEGVDPKTLQVDPGGIRYTQNALWIPAGTPPRTLTRNQRILVATSDRNRPIPLPVVATTPTPVPRVGLPVSFWVTNQHQTADLGFGQVTMRARLVYLQVTPDPAQGRTVGCAGAGLRATPASTPADGGCWWTFDRSSASQQTLTSPGPAGGPPRPAYQVPATASWTVEYRVGAGAWTTFATFERRQALLQPVTEIQTLVVP